MDSKIISMLETVVHDSTPDTERDNARRKINALLGRNNKSLASFLTSFAPPPSRAFVPFSEQQRQADDLRKDKVMLEAELRAVKRKLDRETKRADDAEEALKAERGRMSVSGELPYLEFIARLNKKLGTDSGSKKIFEDATGINIFKYKGKMVPADVVAKINTLKRVGRPDVSRIDLARRTVPRKERDQWFMDRFARLYSLGSAKTPLYRQITDEWNGTGKLPLATEGAVKNVICKARQGKIKLNVPTHLQGGLD